MPAPSPYRRRTPSPTLTNEKRSQLLDGDDFLSRAYGDDGWKEAQARADWLEWRDELVQFWTQPPPAHEARDAPHGFYNPTPGGPGTRPWAWWYFDAPEPRRVTGWRRWERAANGWMPQPAGQLLGNWRTFWGMFPTATPGYPDFETEDVYLRRLGLLLPGESLSNPRSGRFR